MMEVTLIEAMGSDLTVVNAARVSFDKESEWEAEYELSDKDKSLISFLAKNGHWSPFAHPHVTFRIKAPIFVARQLIKHQVGLAWNEISRRYVDSKPEFYVPEKWRARADNVKQGSSDEEVTSVCRGVFNTVTPSEVYERICEYALDVYEDFLDAGVCPEMARMVLPLSMMTEWYWTGSLYAFARVCKQRLDPHAQAETRIIAEQISSHMQELFPISWEALVR